MTSKSNSDSIKENVIHAARILINRGICEAFGAWEHYKKIAHNSNL